MQTTSLIRNGVQVSGRADKLELITPRVKLEQYYQTIIENISGGSHRYIAGIGFTDVTLANAHIEIKNARNYAMTAGQLLKYHLGDPRDNRVVILFGPLTVSPDFLVSFFSHTIATHVLWFDQDDNLHPIYQKRVTSPYWPAPRED